MDPINIASTWGWAMYDALLTFDAQGNVIGNVAEKYDLSPDGLTWTFNIRKGIKFHNGDPLTSADVVFSLQRFGSKESTNPWSPYILKNNESITAPDDYTVVYKAQKPEWPLKIPFGQTHILPKNYFEKVGQDGFRAAPIGSGPYKFAKWVPKTSMEYDANTGVLGLRQAAVGPHHRNPGARGGDPRRATGARRRRHDQQPVLRPAARAEEQGLSAAGSRFANPGQHQLPRARS